ncbi:MAG: rhodanese-like domain-containing protein [Actinobacteria bacterium HGW-Actinobacteria-7]|jgi:rhodanese-related sulfurtransferase|nr:MAG: rhodanese-like domain-containing protein [Actinobacteria bacterium HGW-Actinobacteria-7]
MKPKVILWAVVAVLVAVVIGLAIRPSGGGGITNVDAAGAKKAIAAGAQIVDVRTAGEFQMGHIAGAINVPVDQIESAAQSWDREATYVVYCATGARSSSAVQSMQAMGFKNIAHLAAGIQAWTDPLESGQQSSAPSSIETSGKPVMVEFFTDS